MSDLHNFMRIPFDLMIIMVESIKTFGALILLSKKYYIYYENYKENILSRLLSHEYPTWDLCPINMPDKIKLLLWAPYKNCIFVLDDSVLISDGNGGILYVTNYGTRTKLVFLAENCSEIKDIVQIKKIQVGSIHFGACFLILTSRGEIYYHISGYAHNLKSYLTTTHIFCKRLNIQSKCTKLNPGLRILCDNGVTYRYYMNFYTDPLKLQYKIDTTVQLDYISSSALENINAYNDFSSVTWKSQQRDVIHVCEIEARNDYIVTIDNTCNIKQIFLNKNMHRILCNI